MKMKIKAQTKGSTHIYKKTHKTKIKDLLNPKPNQKKPKTRQKKKETKNKMKCQNQVTKTPKREERNYSTKTKRKKNQNLPNQHKIQNQGNRAQNQGNETKKLNHTQEQSCIFTTTHNSKHKQLTNIHRIITQHG